MTASQYQIDPTSHAADAAMTREQAGGPAGSTLTPEELAGYAQMNPADVVSTLANGRTDVPRDSPLHKLSGDQLRNEMQRSMKAISDFRSVQQSVNRLESKAAISQDMGSLIGRPAFDSAGNAILDQTGSEFQKAEQAAEQSRRSARQAGLADYEYLQAVAQLESTNPNANTSRPPATPSGEPYEIHKGTDGSYEVTLDTGEHFLGKDADDVIQKLTHSKHKTTIWGRDLSRQLKELRGGNGQSTPQASTQPQPNLTFNQNQALPNSDIAEQFATSVGYSNFAELANEWQAMKNQLAATQEFSQQYQNQQIVNEFVLRNPDFPAGDQNAIATLQQIVEQSDLDPSKAENWSLAHRHAIAQGLYKPLPPESELATTQSRHAPPQPPSGSSPDFDRRDVNPWAMATDELRKRLLEQGGLGKALMEMPAGGTLGQ